MGGLCQTSVRRSAAGAGISRPLHPSRRHFQPAPAGCGKWPSLVSMERLSDPGPIQQLQGDDSGGRRVYSPFSATRAAVGLATHSLWRLARQLPPQGQSGSLPPTPGAAGGLASSAGPMPRLVRNDRGRVLAPLSGMRHWHDDPGSDLARLPMAHYPPTRLLMTTPRSSLVHRTAVGSAAQALVLSGCQPTNGKSAHCLAPPLAYHHFSASTNSLVRFEPPPLGRKPFPP